ncbi:MAG: 30S ribosomal protein S12 methylthiotransferase RimO [bacterium]|nr:MAG: 30S ribosomal protein S12 methylthiotransferase RimO [bacterium]
MKVAVTSLGCSKNLVDTEVMLGHLARAGCSVVEEPEGADCLLVNTCAFLTEAVQEALDRIVELAQYRSRGDVARLVVTGCLVSRYGSDLRKEIPEIDALVGPSSLEEVVEAVTGRSDSVNEKEQEFPLRLRSSPGHRAYLKVGEGCSNHCTYCLIPHLRGPFRSRTADSVISEAGWLMDQGVREISLVAQDTGRFGSDNGEGNLAGLVRRILALPGDAWIRILYVHPSRIEEQLLDVMVSDSRVCRYMDIPFQHVSAAVLDRMGRMEVPRAEAVLRRVRDAVPGVFIRTTLMTGFPGETGEDFRELLRFVEGADIDHLGVFPYSREEGTPAASMAGGVGGDVAVERARILMEIQDSVSSRRLGNLVGKRLDVLAEGTDEKGPFGRHRGQAPEVDGVVRLDRTVEPGRVVPVRIVGSGVYDLIGEVLGTKG